jgi:hypothetical protein
MVTACSSVTDKWDKTDLDGIRWENRDLDFIGFDSTLIYVPIKDEYPTTCAYNFELRFDTLRIINKTVNASNIISLKDSVSLLKIEYLEQDSLRLSLLNEGARELFRGFVNLTFYNSKRLDRFTYYREKDPACRNAIDSATVDIKSNMYRALINPSWPFRNEKEFIELLKNDGIEYVNMGPPPDVLPIDRDCYRETMNYYISRKFGDDYFERVLVQADSLMIMNSKGRVFAYYECDTEPQIEGQRNGTSEIYIKTSLPVKENRKEWKTRDNENMFAVYNPFIDLGFRVDTLGQLTEFRTNNFVPELEWNNQFKDKLFEIGIKEIKASGKWTPGTILGKKVNANHNVRLQFKSGKI